MNQVEQGVSRSDILSLVGGVRLDQRQDILFQFTANKLDEPRLGLVVDYPELLQFWEMGVVKRDPDALAMFIGCSLSVFVSNPVCNSVYERIVC